MSKSKFIQSLHSEHPLMGTSHIQTLVDILLFRAENQPDKTLYTFLKDGETQEESWTCAQLHQKARVIGATLQQLGAEGERVLLLYPSGLEFIAGYYGCLYAGAIAVPVYPPRKNRIDERLMAVAHDSQAAFALTTQGVVDAISSMSDSDEHHLNLQWIATENLDDDIGESWSRPNITKDSLAFLQYTSGSTGTPKGVMVSYETLLHNSELIRNCFDVMVDKRILMWTPFFHDMGLLGGVIQPLYAKTPITLMAPIDFLQKPLRWLKGISDRKITTSGGPNFAFELCINKISPEQQEGLDLSYWDVAFMGAEPIRADTLERFCKKFEPNGFNYGVYTPCLGMAETTVFTTGTPKGQHPKKLRVDSLALRDNRVVPLSDSDSDSASSGEQSADEAKEQVFISSGQAYADLEVYMVNPETRLLCKDYEIGEFWVAGLSVTQGYWMRPEETAETFHATIADDESQRKYLRTGDLGFSAEGEFYVTGRLKDLIIIRGRNHYPQDIELTAESSHPALHLGGVAAFSIEHNDSEKLVIIQEVSREAMRDLDGDEIIGAIRGAVSEAHALQLHAIQLIKPGRIPKTSSGKIQRRMSKKMYLADRFETVAAWENQDVEKSNRAEKVDPSSYSNLDKQSREGIQQWITLQLAQKANIDSRDIDLDKPFSEYGIDSIGAVEMVQDLDDWLDGKVDIDPTALWDFPTVDSLVGHLMSQIAQTESDESGQPANSPAMDERSLSKGDASFEDDLAHLESLLE